MLKKIIIPIIATLVIIEYARNRRKKNIPLIACLGKEVCIYRGPKLNYPARDIRPYTINDDNLLIISGFYNYNYHKLTNFIPRKLLGNVFGVYVYQRYDRKFDKLIPGYRGWSFEQYDPKTKKMKKLKDIKSIDFQIKSKKENYLITKEKILRFNKITNNVETLHNLKNFQPNTDLDVEKFYLGPYNNNILMITNYNNVSYTNATRAQTINYDYKFDDRLLEFDVKKLTYKIFPKFAVKPKFFPYLGDFIILDNGKIIIPIRTTKCKYDYFKKDCSVIWDHIEIYDPKTNSFTAEFNSDVLNHNLFRINLPDENILFINKNSSYIFNNKTNKFIKTQKQDEEKYQAAVNKIQQYLYNLMHIGLDENILFSMERIKIIPVNNEKYLITCGDAYYSYPYYKKRICRQTVYYNFTKNEVKPGPKFLYPLFLCKIRNTSDKTLMAICGSSSFGYDYSADLPYQYMQIIRYKN